MADFNELLEIAFDAKLLEVHTSIPVRVTAVDMTNLTVDCQIVVKRLKQDDTALDFPPLMEVPIGYTQTKKYAITIPIEVGDTGQVIFNERNLDEWIVNNTEATPPDRRKHSLSDGLFIPNFVNRANNLTSVSTSELEIRSRDNATKIRINTNGTITADCVNFVVNASGSFTVNSPQSKFIGGTVKNDGVSIDKTHTHTQNPDSAGNTQAVTNPPNN